MAILPAASTSMRMGRPKKLLPPGNTTIGHCYDPLYAAGITDVTIGMNPGGRDRVAALHGMLVTSAR